MSRPYPPSTEADPLKDALRQQVPRLLQAARLSVVTGLMSLTPSWYMLEVYGRVLDSRSHATLGWLLLVVAGAFVVLELLDWVRSRVLYEAGESFDERLRPLVFATVFEANLRRIPGGTPQALHDLKTIKEFFSAPAVTTAMDVPAAVICLILLYLISPWLCAMAAIGALLQLGLATITQRRTTPLLNEATSNAIEAQAYAGGAMRSADVVESMGMLGAIRTRWLKRQRAFLARQAQASDHAGVTGVGAKLVQNAQSSLLLGASCWLVLHDQMAGGGALMIVASILGARVLQPLAQMISQWRSIVGARDAYTRLGNLLSRVKLTEAGMPLPPPKGHLTVESVSAGAPGGNTPIIKGLNLSVQPGEILAIIGPSAAGKTTLARLLVGIWPCSSGRVRLDGVDVHAWHKSQLGPHLGYLPQGIELFDGTVAENIARFGRVDMEAVRLAAGRVGITALIEGLPQGFDTRIGDEGAVLSGGQRQRLGLARAIYGSPTLLVLDEPNSSLDEAGERSLLQLLTELQRSGTTIVVITHRTGLLQVSSKLLVLRDGSAVAFGPRDEVMAALKNANEKARARKTEMQALSTSKLSEGEGR